MTHYWGAKTIAKRLGIGEHTLYRWIDKMGLPVYLRSDPRCVFRRVLYCNEAMLLAWELSRAADYRERRVAGKTVKDPQVINRLSSAQMQKRMKHYAEIHSDQGQLISESSSL